VSTATSNTQTNAAGLRRIRLHDLRHGHASLMLAAGVDMSLVSKRIGHSSQAITVERMRTFCPASAARPQRRPLLWCRESGVANR
jgi:integrase